MVYWKQLFIVAALSCASAQGATNFYAQALAAETNVYLGQVFNIDIIVKASEMPETPSLDNLTDFNATVIDSGRATSETNTWMYRFAFRAKKEGALSIPALRFGNVYSEAIGIRANKPEQTDRMQLSQNVSTQTAYVGEPILLTTVWDTTYQFGAIKAVDFYFPVLNDNQFQVLELYEPGKESNAQTTGLPVHGTRILATRNSYSVEETQHQSLEFSKLLIPKKSGILLLPPATLLCAAEKELEINNKTRRSAFQYPAYFDNTFFDQNVTGKDWTRIYAESKPIELEIKPLPREGRPDLFNGMVGDYTIEVVAEPTQVRVGEPITLTITITAAGYMENIFFEPLRYQPLLVNRFDIPSDRSLPTRTAHAKVYTQTIRPLSTANTEIPPLQLAYFSPTSNAYITAQSASIPLTVTVADEIGIFGGGIMHSRLRTVGEGIRHNYENPDMLKNRRLPLFGWASAFVVVLTLLLPPLLFGGYALIALFGEKKHHIHRTAKAARAYKAFRKNSAQITHGLSMKSEIYTELDQVLRAYLGDRLHLNPGALSFRAAEKRLGEAGASQETLDELARLFTLCEAYRFTTLYDEQADARQIVRDANQLVRSLENSLK